MAATIRKVIRKLDDNNMELIFQVPPAETYQLVAAALKLGDAPATENFIHISVTPAAKRDATFIVARQDMTGITWWFWEPAGVFLAGGDEISGILADPTDLSPVWLEFTLRAL
jgi:hypothetical protein